MIELRDLVQELAVMTGARVEGEVRRRSNLQEVGLLLIGLVIRIAVR
jgi:hypothetical protein